MSLISAQQLRTRAHQARPFASAGVSGDEKVVLYNESGGVRVSAPSLARGTDGLAGRTCLPIPASRRHA